MNSSLLRGGVFGTLNNLTRQNFLSKSSCFHFLSERIQSPDSLKRVSSTDHAPVKRD